jgi:hypothetical protein
MYAPKATAPKSREFTPLRDAGALPSGLVVTPLSELLVELLLEESRGGGTALVGVYSTPLIEAATSKTEPPP